MQPVLEMLTERSDIKASESACQVKKRMSTPGLDPANHKCPRRKLKTLKRKIKQNRPKTTKLSSSLGGKRKYNFRMVLADALSNGFKS